MFRAVVAVAVVANLIDATRIATEVQSKSATTFGASCEDLQGLFRSRVVAVQAHLNTYQNATGITSFAQARITMRVFGVVRTLRRARNCRWVLDGDSEDIEQARSVVQQALAENPCAEAAMAEMTPEAFDSAANQLQPLQRAMIVLVSESCEVHEQEEVEEAASAEDEDALEHRLVDTEEEMQDHIDELFEQAALESESMADGSFVQTDSKARAGLAYVLRVVGAVFIAVLLALVCVPVWSWIGYFFFMVLRLLLFLVVPMGSAVDLFLASSDVFVVYGVVIGGFVGFGACAYALALELMPTRIRDPTRMQ